MNLKRQTKSYSVIAPFYDRLMNGSKYKRWKELIERTIRQYKIPKGRAIDLACGTGRTSKMLFDLGFDVIGIDKSKEMLKIAKSKYPDINFILRDICMVFLPLKERADFAISFYDSLNYLTTDEKMMAMFNSVAQCLKPGGIFLFDINTKEHVRLAQKKGIQLFDFDGIFIIFKHSGEKNFWQIEMDFFIKQAKGSFKMMRERHIEKGYSESDIKKLLKKSPFKLLDIKKEERYYKKMDHRSSSRMYFVVQRVL